MIINNDTIKTQDLSNYALKSELSNYMLKSEIPSTIGYKEVSYDRKTGNVTSAVNYLTELNNSGYSLFLTYYRLYKSSSSTANLTLKIKYGNYSYLIGTSNGSVVKELEIFFLLSRKTNVFFFIPLYHVASNNGNVTCSLTRTYESVSTSYISLTIDGVGGNKNDFFSQGYYGIC